MGTAIKPLATLAGFVPPGPPTPIPLCISPPESAVLFTQTVCQEVWNWSQKHTTAAEAQPRLEACGHLQQAWTQPDH